MFKVTLFHNATKTQNLPQTPTEQNGFYLIEDKMIPVSQVDICFDNDSGYDVTYTEACSTTLYVESISCSVENQLTLGHLRADTFTKGKEILGFSVVEENRITLRQGEFYLNSGGYQEISELAFENLNVMRCPFVAEGDNFFGYADENKIVVLYADRYEPRFFKAV